MTRAWTLLRRVLCILRGHAGVHVERPQDVYVFTCKRCGAAWKEWGQR